MRTEWVRAVFKEVSPGARIRVGGRVLVKRGMREAVDPETGAASSVDPDELLEVEEFVTGTEGEQVDIIHARERRNPFGTDVEYLKEYDEWPCPVCGAGEDDENCADCPEHGHTRASMATFHDLRETVYLSCGCQVDIEAQGPHQGKILEFRYGGAPRRKNPVNRKRAPGGAGGGKMRANPDGEGWFPVNLEKTGSRWEAQLADEKGDALSDANLPGKIGQLVGHGRTEDEAVQTLMAAIEKVEKNEIFAPVADTFDDDGEDRWMIYIQRAVPYKYTHRSLRGPISGRRNPDAGGEEITVAVRPAGKGWEARPMEKVAAAFDRRNGTRISLLSASGQEPESNALANLIEAMYDQEGLVVSDARYLGGGIFSLFVDLPPEPRGKRMRRRNPSFAPGATVRLTGEFLRNTGQIAGGEGQSVWTVVEHPGCGLCASGRYVAVNQASSYFGGDPGAPGRGRAFPRHILAANLESCRPRRNPSVTFNALPRMSLFELTGESWEKHPDLRGVIFKKLAGNRAVTVDESPSRKIQLTPDEPVIPVTEEERELMKAGLEYYDPEGEGYGCSRCGGPLVPLGALGAVAHYRCRDCGGGEYRKNPGDGPTPIPEGEFFMESVVMHGWPVLLTRIGRSMSAKVRLRVDGAVIGDYDRKQFAKEAAEKVTWKNRR